MAHGGLQPEKPVFPSPCMRFESLLTEEWAQYFMCRVLPRANTFRLCESLMRIAHVVTFG
jgi:hypothetical protein